MLDDILQQKLMQLGERKLQRDIQTTTPSHGVKVMRNGKELISFCGNDYFGLASNERVVEASISGTRAYGAGAGASRLVTGNHPLYQQLEVILAQMKNTQAACVFGSGYMANIGIIPALVGKGDLIIADKLVHRSILGGIKLSGAALKRFAHNDVDSAKRIISKERGKYNNCLMITETVFSMDGDVAPLVDLRALCDEYDAWLMTDDAHGLGIVKSAAQADIQMGTLSKAVGSYGGYVCGSQVLIDYLHSAANSVIYSTALPPSVIAASIAALELIYNNNYGQQVIDKAKIFTDILGLEAPQSAIVPIIIGGVEETLSIASALEAQGFLVSAIRPPTVPKGSSRLRVTFSVLHDDGDIKRLAEAVKSIHQKNA